MRSPWTRPNRVGVLVVCTGNVCRSPYVAARLSAALPALQVVSAGTAALVGSPPTAAVSELLAGHGIVDELPVARSLTRRAIGSAALILTAERAHRVRVAQLAASAADRTFTVRELARLLAGADGGIGLDAVLATARAAVVDDACRDHDDDLADPYGGTDEDYLRMAATADDALGVLVPALGGRWC